LKIGICPRVSGFKFLSKIPSTATSSFKSISTPTPVPSKPEFPRSSNLAIPKVFSEHDKDTFITKAFDYMARFFEGSLQELKTRKRGNSGLLGTGVGVLILLNELVAVEGIFAIKCLATVSMFWIISRNASSKLRYFSTGLPSFVAA
jgi:hypothetical protein